MNAWKVLTQVLVLAGGLSFVGRPAHSAEPSCRRFWCRIRDAAAGPSPLRIGLERALLGIATEAEVNEIIPFLRDFDRPELRQDPDAFVLAVCLAEELERLPTSARAIEEIYIRLGAAMSDGPFGARELGARWRAAYARSKLAIRLGRDPKDDLQFVLLHGLDTESVERARLSLAAEQLRAGSPVEIDALLALSQASRSRVHRAMAGVLLFLTTNSLGSARVSFLRGARAELEARTAVGPPIGFRDLPIEGNFAALLDALLSADESAFCRAAADSELSGLLEAARQLGCTLRETTSAGEGSAARSIRKKAPPRKE